MIILPFNIWNNVKKINYGLLPLNLVKVCEKSQIYEYHFYSPPSPDFKVHFKVNKIFMKYLIMIHAKLSKKYNYASIYIRFFGTVRLRFIKLLHCKIGWFNLDQYSVTLHNWKD